MLCDAHPIQLYVHKSRTRWLSPQFDTCHSKYCTYDMSHPGACYATVSNVTADASRAQEKGSVGAAWLTLVLSAAG